MVNNPLSQQRADAVRIQLVAAGVPANTTTSMGMGSANPVDPAKTKERARKIVVWKLKSLWMNRKFLKKGIIKSGRDSGLFISTNPAPSQEIALLSLPVAME